MYDRAANPPLPALPSLYISVLLLSYVGFKDEVLPLMKSLCKNMANLLKKVPAFVNEYIQEFLPRSYFTKPLNFNSTHFNPMQEGPSSGYEEFE